MSHFDPRIINSNPKSISGTPILVGIGLCFHHHPAMGVRGVCSAGKRGRAGLFRTGYG